MILTNLTMGILAWIPLAVNRHVSWGYAVIIGVGFLVQTALYVDEISHNAYLKYLVTSRQLPKAEGILQSAASGGFIVGLGVVFGLLKYGKVPSFLLFHGPTNSRAVRPGQLRHSKAPPRETRFRLRSNHIKDFAPLFTSHGDDRPWYAAVDTGRKDPRPIVMGLSAIIREPI